METAEGIEVYYSEIHAALQEYIDDRQIEDMSKETQNKWNAALIYIYNTVFKGTNKLTGISTDCILKWGGKGGTYGEGIQDAGSAGLALHKKLTDERQESLSGMLISGKRPPVAILGALNRWYGWNMGQPQTIEQTDRPQLSQDEIHQIAEKARKESIPELIEGLPDE